MKLGFMGWWKGKNEGDKYIKYCLKRSFSDYNVTFLSNWGRRIVYKKTTTSF